MKILLTALPLLLSCDSPPEQDLPPVIADNRTLPVTLSRSIEVLLAASPIDVAALERILLIPPESVRVVTPPTCAASFAPLDGEWRVENVGNTPLVMAKKNLEVNVYSHLFVPVGGRCCGVMDSSVSRPDFHPQEWFLLHPGESVPLLVERPGEGPGEHRYSALIGGSGRRLCHQANSFNARESVPYPEELLRSSTWIKHVILPARSSWKQVPWHGRQSMNLKHVGRGRFVGLWMLETKVDRDSPLELEGYVIDESNRVLYGGPLTPVGHQTRWVLTPTYYNRGTLQVRTVYQVPEPLEPGSYSLLTRVRPPGRRWFGSPFEACACSAGCQSDDRLGGISDWKPFRIAGETNPIQPGRNVARRIAVRVS